MFFVNPPEGADHSLKCVQSKIQHHFCFKNFWKWAALMLCRKKISSKELKKILQLSHICTTCVCPLFESRIFFLYLQLWSLAAPCAKRMHSTSVESLEKLTIAFCYKKNECIFKLNQSRGGGGQRWLSWEWFALSRRIYAFLMPRTLQKMFDSWNFRMSKRRLKFL